MSSTYISTKIVEEMENLTKREETLLYEIQDVVR